MKMPPGFATLTPYLIVNEGESMLRFLREGLGGVIRLCHREGGRIIHAQIQIGNSMLMMAEVDEQESTRPASFYLFVEDAEIAQSKALAAGAREKSPVSDMPYGDRHGEIEDPCGNTWWLAQRLVDGDYQ